jgi:hypothetical protein
MLEEIVFPAEWHTQFDAYAFESPKFVVPSWNMCLRWMVSTRVRPRGTIAFCKT